LKEKNNHIYIYGPVPSRRLGYSLGIDILPFKTCTLDCIYCQLSPTTNKTIKRKKFYPYEAVMSQIKESVFSGKKINYITFSGSGEPTLNLDLGKMIREIKKITSIPVAVLTNSTLLIRESVRESLMTADLVVPSLDAATQDIFLKINRPHKSLHIDEVIEELNDFNKKYKGLLWLEIMLVRGLNDSPQHIKKLSKAISDIAPDRIQLNTVIRPPAEKFAKPLSLKEMEKIRDVFGEKCEIIAQFNRKEQSSQSENLEKDIISLIQRRPVTLFDISNSLGKNQNEIIKYLDILIKEKKIKEVEHKGLIFYEPIL
jgi:wyosine [tRNA(Phe)-imidazoG37] synthetase (radical SAM superfamily)